MKRSDDKLFDWEKANEQKFDNVDELFRLD